MECAGFAFPSLPPPADPTFDTAFTADKSKLHTARLTYSDYTQLKMNEVRGYGPIWDGFTRVRSSGLVL